MPITNQFESSIATNNKLSPHSLTLKIGEPSIEENEIETNIFSIKLGEPSDGELTESDLDPDTPDILSDINPNIDDNYYFQIVLDNIGKYTQYNKLYSKHNVIIGRGCESIVYKGTNIKTGNEVAIQETIINTKNELINWFGKYCVIKQCNLFNIYDAYLYNISDEQYKIILIQELFENNITQIMYKNAIECDNCNLNENEIRKMISDILTQLKILSDSGYNHLDIKPTNIMKKYNGKYTLIDFGFMSEYNTYNGYLGTKNWSSPEMNPNINNNIIYNNNDMWSIGLIIIYCLFNGKHPFMTKNKKTDLKYIQKWYTKKIYNKQNYIEKWLGKQLINNKISYHLFDFLFKCLKFDPQKRMNIGDALKHKWINN
eukprot:105165_1